MCALVLVALLHPSLCLDSVTASETLDLEKIYNQAEMDMEHNQVEEFASGATSKRFHQKRDSALTKEMAKRNSLFRKMNSNLESQGLSSKDSRDLAKKALMEWYEVKFTQAGVGKTFLMPKHCDDIMPSCNDTVKYRSIDGTCNNLQSPRAGSAASPFLRFRSTWPASIEDPIKEMNFHTNLTEAEPNQVKQHGCHLRKSLPNARLVSSIVHSDKNAPNTKASHFTTQFGQFLDHDITATPEEEVEHCCDSIWPSAGNEACWPIDVAHDEFFYAKNVTCLEFTRSVPHCEENGGQRNQMNAITAFVDGSQVYGSDLELAENLRTFTNGELKITEKDSGNLLPKLPNHEGELEFTAGDFRAREIPRLNALHTVWVREHNRVAEILSSEFSDDEEIYQLARRVVVAEYQNIVYGQFMSEILGSDDLKPSIRGSNYIPKIDPSMRNEFATAAFRFGHSIVQGNTTLLAVDNPDQPVGFFQLRDVFLEDDFYINAFDNLLMELIFRPAQSNDASVSEELTNNLFANFQSPSDLVARNLQRGRDHGIPGFCCYYRRFQAKGFDCQSGWETKYEGIPDEIWSKMQEVYDHPSDIDLFTGGISQLSSGQGQLGGVFRAMISDQFTRTMKGDRFFFNHQNCPTLGGVGFTKDAREIVQTRTMSGVICDTTSLTKVTSNVFQINGDVINCSETAKIDKAEIMQIIKFNSCE